MLKSNDFKIRIILVMLAFCLVLTLGLTLNPLVRADANQAAANAAAGSAEDPLITLSYLNSVLSGSALNSLGSLDLSDFSSAYTVLELWRGDKVRAGTNSVELILRPGGEAKVISPHDIMVLADLTSGIELMNGDDLPKNHVVLIPRADGRAISITSEVAYIMVRGDYEVFK